eukprot:2324326-Ditylum_brightwellii.AAC.1
MLDTTYPRPNTSLTALNTFLNNTNKDQHKHQMQPKMISTSGAPSFNELPRVTPPTTSFLPPHHHMLVGCFRPWNGQLQ